MKRLILAIICIVLFISACSSAQPPEPPTSSPEPTEIPPTFTATAPPTQPPTETPVPTPTPDMRVILEEPKALVLLIDDLPEDGQYFISQDKGTLSNDMIVHEFTQELGQETAALVDLYLQATSRLDGYSQVWTRGSWGFDGPLHIANEIAVFKTVKGAQLDVMTYKPQLFMAMDGRIPSHNDILIGDTTRIYIDTVVSNGQEADIILVEFSYQNAVIDIGCWGETGKYTLDDVLVIAENVFNRLLELPLGEFDN